MMMSNMLCLTVMEVQKEWIRMVNEDLVKFNNPEVFADHYIYIGTVENKNDLIHDRGTKY